MSRRGWWGSGAVAAGLVVASGCGISSGACPLWVGAGGASVQATSYVEAHPRAAAKMGVCVFDGGTPCDVAAATKRLEPLAGGPPVVNLGSMSPGTHRVRVVLTDSAGRVVLDVTGPLKVHHPHESSGCRHIMGGYGSSRLDAHGRLTSN